MSTPFCHRTLGPRVYVIEQALCVSREDATPTLCRGSDCALWVPEHTRVHPVNDQHLPGLVPPGGPAMLRRESAPTDRGVCADNLRREPWTDPAAGASS